MVVRFFPSCVVTRFSLIPKHIFLCWILSPCLDYIFSLLVLGCPIVFCFFLFFSFFANRFMSSMYIRWLIASNDLLKLYLPVHFLRMWLNGIIPIRNRNGDSLSSWKIPVRIFTSGQFYLPSLQFDIFFSREFMISSDTLYLSENVYYLGLQDHIVCFLLSIYAIASFGGLDLLSLRMCRSIYNSSLVLLVPLCHTLFSLGNNPWPVNE